MHVFVVNLDRRADRMAMTATILKRIGLAFERVSAFDAQSNDIRPYVEWNRAFIYSEFRPPLRGAVGCFLSHRAIWQQIVDRGISQALVIEDDIRLGAFDKRFLNVDLASLELDLLRLEEVKIQGANLAWTSLQKPIPIHDRQAEFRRSFGTAAYLVTQRGATRLLSVRKYWFELDHFEMWKGGTGLRTAILNPSIFRQAEGESDIAEVARAGAEPVIAPKLGYYADEGWQELPPLNSWVIRLFSRMPARARGTLAFYFRTWWKNWGW
jgi:GR25 family glycosyltransferase involved in LPS biosynthesis